MNANDIRREFLDFFVAKGHEEVASSPLVPRNDPSLMFANSGMVQFKDVFTGQEQRPYRRAVTAQKCVRAGGKHNDLENVGYTARHHTFFEMLGNFSFGDYFKEQAIEAAWTLVTQQFGLPKERLLVTIFHEDEEAANLWKKIAGLPEHRIIKIATSDNFWQMGDTGPCGPCSEIFYDHGEEIAGGPPGSKDEDGDRFIEIWNLVFMQYEQFTDGTRTNLPSPSIDTGMGLERIAAILQNVHSNYDVDLMRALIEQSADLTDGAPDGPLAASHRVLADHLRASAFLIADGILPSNEGRGYVLRRIMRRAMRHAHLLGAEDPLLHRLLPRLITTMGGHYHELQRAEALIHETLKLEETKFRQTLSRGLKLLEDATEKLGGNEALPGDVAFILYDRYGFPVDLTADIMRREGRALDMAGFDAAMAEQRNKARAAWSGSGETATDQLWYQLKDTHGASEFLGYHTTEAAGTLQACIIDGKEAAEIQTGQSAQLLMNQTPFYGESGGQQGDQGMIKSEDGAEFIVHDTQKRLDNLIIHKGECVKGNFKAGQAVQLKIDQSRRSRLTANHSVTHLAHRALRDCLGDHVTQKGSQVAADTMRFDFSHPRPVTEQELHQIEADVNQAIRMNYAVETRIMTPDAAIEAGALALFGEKYGEEVRVVAMDDYSVELCGGTHVKQTGEIGLFKITHEQGVASGIRRIECLTGAAAFDYLVNRNKSLEQVAQLLKTSADTAVDKVRVLYDERRKLDRDLAQLQQKLALHGDQATQSHSTPQQIDGISFICKPTEGLPAKALKPLVDQLKQEMGSGIAAVSSVNEGKVSLVVGVTDDLTARFDAVSLVRLGSPLIGGKGGGGRLDMAQAGGSDSAGLPAAFEAIEQAIRKAVHESC